MSVNGRPQETDLIDAGVDWLRSTLPESWKVERSPTHFANSAAPQGATVDAMITIGMQPTSASFIVEAKRGFSARDAQRLLAGVARSLLVSSGRYLLVISDWLGPRTQALLRDQSVSYVDLTGNAYVRADYPPLFIQHNGATRNPAPPERSAMRLRGPKAWRLIRLLVDVQPPYTVGDLARASELTPGYVSRLLTVLDDEALIDRTSRGGVESVEAEPLLRRWAESYDVLKNNDAVRFLAPAGAPAAAAQLGSMPPQLTPVVTGSFAAVQLAPVAAPAMLMVYTRDPRSLGEKLGLIAVDSKADANVLAMAPYDPIVWAQTETRDGIAYAAPSQVAVDCLTGPGRMPQEGEAVLEWMSRNGSWRRPSLDAEERRTESFIR